MLTTDKLDLAFTTDFSLLDKVPFPVKRLYWIYGVPTDAIRGTHAHRACKEYLLLLQGQLMVEIKNIEGELGSYTLTEPGEGLYIPPMLWKEIRFASDAVLLVAASEKYDADDYIYADEFTQLCLQIV